MTIKEQSIPLLFSAKHVYQPVFTVPQVLQIQSCENTCTNDSENETSSTFYQDT